MDVRNWGNFTPINQKRFFLAFAAVAVFVLGSDFLMHGYWLDSTYKATASLWRSEAEMKRMVPWMLLGQMLSAYFLCLIFAQGYQGKGWKEGLRFALLVAPFGLAHTFIQFSVTPIPGELFAKWILGGFLQYTGASVIAAAVYSGKGFKLP